MEKSCRTTLHYIIQNNGARDLVLPPWAIVTPDKQTIVAVLLLLLSAHLFVCVILTV